MDAQNAPDLVVARLAALQWGVVRRQQLVDAGLSRTAIAGRVRRGRLLPQYPGVYAVGHDRLRVEGRWLAAVFACGTGAVLSHRSAAAAWGLLPPGAARIDVTTADRNGRRAPAGVRVHRVRRLPAEETTVQDAIPIVIPERAILELAADLDARPLEAVIAEADRRWRFDLAVQQRLLANHPRRPGAPKLRALLRGLEGGGPPVTHSSAEVDLLQLCDDHEVPIPVANAIINGFEVDFHWPQTTLIVEVDGYRFHRTQAAFAADRERDQALSMAAYRVVRFPALQLQRDPAGALAAAPVDRRVAGRLT